MRKAISAEEYLSVMLTGESWVSIPNKRKYPKHHGSLCVSNYLQRFKG